MPSLPPDQNYNVVWRFRCNTKTREYFLTVCYYSNDPPAKHEIDHDSLKTRAFEWLLKNGHSPDPDKIKIEFKRLDEVQKPDDDQKIKKNDQTITDKEEDKRAQQLNSRSN